MNLSSSAGSTGAFPQPAVERALVEVRRLLRQGHYHAALESLAEVECAHPQSGLLWSERGACHQGLREPAAALAAYRRAVQLNDAVPSSWRALLDICRTLGADVEAERAAACLARLNALPAQLAAACSLLNEGDLESAENLLRDYLSRHGPHIEGMRFLAQLGIKRKVFDDAELLLQHLLERAPDYHDARYEYQLVLAERRKYLGALDQSLLLLRVQPDNFLYRLACARSLDGLGRYDEAIDLYRKLLAENPGSFELQLSIAHALQVRGNRPAAIEAFKLAARVPETFSSACFALANTKAYRFSADEIEQMRTQEAATNAPLIARYQLCFALGKALEDRKQFADAFIFYERGNALKRSELRYSPELAELQLRTRASVWTREFIAARSGVGCNRRDPIFVVGLARSGSTLIEQILASHSQVDGTLELPTIPHLVNQFRNRDSAEASPRYPAVLAELAPVDFQRMGEIYLEDTGPYRGSAPFFVDKMLANFREVGLIHLILPNARIIDARREAMACCFGNFKQLFTNGQEYSYSLAEMGRYYREYVALMDHWDRVLPGKILRVRYEELVDDLEANVRRMLEFCGLPFEPACLEFYKTERSVRTVSSEQVRRPIYREGLDQWRHYEPWLGPLEQALGR